MKKIFLSILIVWIALPGVKAQSMQDIKTVTAFIYVQTGTALIPYGTCFFVGLKSNENPDNSYLYLVTAKHVLQDKQGMFLEKIFVRINHKDSTSSAEMVPLSAAGKNKNVFVNDDPSVDIAVVPIFVKISELNIKFLDQTFLSSRQEFKSLNLQEGTEAFFTGLFTGYVGNKQIYPIVRFGRIALIPSEKIFFTGQNRELLLIESSSYGGNSGSPVYFKINYLNGTSQLKLGGILNGTFRDVSEIIESSGRDVPLATLNNNGISGITPIYLLNEILFGSELSNRRK
jgi:hypothetical protein